MGFVKQEWGTEYPASRGLNLLKKHRSGVKLSISQMIQAKCCECMGCYTDGKRDCEIELCPLYPRMPWRVKE